LLCLVEVIKTGSRSVLSYLLSPLFRYRHESLRER
jgi:hemolysin D